MKEVFIDKSKDEPDSSQWLKEAKISDVKNECGIYLFSNGVVRGTSKREVRYGESIVDSVKKVYVKCKWDVLEQAIKETAELPGVKYLRVWVNEGELELGETIMCTLVGADIRDNCVAALTYFVDRLKNDCLSEIETF
ncbi:MAG: molybdenum cofactor biosynthesis protein MoaE [Coriobacteriales bacterium]|nr:molybdenum cofactor biosynthesis protein MoaE [Coriobacteriales bacterium]